jgi:polar amino acid transport system substrate-binding protein
MAFLGLMCAGAQTTAAASLLEQIQAKGKLVVGLFPASPPYGYVNAQGKIEGIDIEIARLMAQDLGVELETVSTSGAARIPTLLTGKVDVLIAVLSITPKRAEQVAYSIPYAGFQIIMYGPADQKVRDWPDLAGKRVGVTLGAVTDTETTRNAPKDTKILRFEDDAATNAALLAGQVDLICATDFVVLGLPERVPDKKLETKFAIRSSPVSIGMRRGDPDFMQWVNTFLFYNKNIGKLGEIYEKHMHQKLPDFGAFCGTRLQGDRCAPIATISRMSWWGR